MCECVYKLNYSRANWCEHFHGMMQQRHQFCFFKFATIYRVRLRKEPAKTRHYTGLGYIHMYI